MYTLIIGRPPFETNDVKTTYKRIRQNNYTFPDTVQITPQAKDLIQRILNNDPTRRPSLDDILSHPWLNNENTIPRCLPPSTLACPPSNTYIRQFINPDNKLQAPGGNYKSVRPNTDRPEGSDWKQVNTDRNYGTAINTERQAAKVI